MRKLSAQQQDTLFLKICSITQASFLTQYSERLANGSDRRGRATERVDTHSSGHFGANCDRATAA